MQCIQRGRGEPAAELLATLAIWTAVYQHHIQFGAEMQELNYRIASIAIEGLSKNF